MTNPLRIGPMTPDEVSAAGGPRTAGGQRTDAMSVIQAVDAAYPPELRAAMQRKRDWDASEKLDLKALSGEFGVNVVGAGVYGLADDPKGQTLIYLYESDSGRTARWFAEFKPEDVPVDEEPEEPEEPEQSEPKPAARPAVEPEPEPEDGEPWPGYSGQSVAEIQDYLDAHDEVDLDQVRVYETAHKNRKGVLDYIEEG